jgi:Outer membrane protein and related peptidoglycan-associated (lipo)proteins
MIRTAAAVACAALAPIALAEAAHAQSAGCASTTIYFDLASPSLPRLGPETLDAFAQGVDSERAVVEIIGHSDSAESGSGLHQLDVQRAAAVAAGFASNEARENWTYRLAGADASQPATASARGVSEPLNRRAEIRICSTER